MLPGNARPSAAHSCRPAFTLIELLVVVAVIGVLIGIIVPVLGKARTAAGSTACKALLRQYALATDMYANEWNDTMVDSFKFLDYECGLPKYMSGGMMPEKIARCPADQSTQAMGRLGLMGNGVDPAAPGTPWPIRRADGTNYTVLCSIGCNQNSLSASRRATSKGFGSMWVRRSKLSGVPGADPSRTMTWSDWQNNPTSTATYKADPVSAIVSPGAAGSSDIGSLCFRHGGRANATFLDGHVGELVPTVGTGDDGHSLTAPWPAWTGFAEGGFPWGPRNNAGTYGVGITVNGTKVPNFPGITIR